MRAYSAMFLIVLGLVGCRSKPSEPEAVGSPKAPPSGVGVVEEPYRGRIGGSLGKLGRPLRELTTTELRTAILAAGWKPSGFTEMESSVAVTRTLPIQKERLTGTVQWFKTSDKERVYSTMVEGWPSAEEGDVIVTVKLTNASERGEARRLLKALTQD